MATNIRFKRGLKANLPTLQTGEPAFTTDTKDYYIGDASVNVLIGGKTITDDIQNIASYINGITPVLRVSSNATAIASGSNIPFPNTIVNKGFTKKSNTNFKSPNLVGTYIVELTLQLAPLNGTANSLTFNVPWNGTTIVTTYPNQNYPTTLRWVTSVNKDIPSDFFIMAVTNSGNNLNTVTGICTATLDIYFVNPTNLTVKSSN